MSMRRRLVHRKLVVDFLAYINAVGQSDESQHCWVAQKLCLDEVPNKLLPIRALMILDSRNTGRPACRAKVIVSPPILTW